MSRANAWVMHFGQGQRAAIGHRELIEVVDEPALFPVPLTPAYAHNVLFWKNHAVAVLNLALRMGERNTDTRLLAVVGYHDTRTLKTTYGALPLTQPPQAIFVSDDQASDLGEALSEWRSMTHACFNLEGARIPVLDLAAVFGP